MLVSVLFTVQTYILTLAQCSPTFDALNRLRISQKRRFELEDPWSFQEAPTTLYNVNHCQIDNLPVALIAWRCVSEDASLRSRFLQVNILNLVLSELRVNHSRKETAREAGNLEKA
jgi:hypothetical protein